MTPEHARERWRRIEWILDLAWDAPPEQRDAVLTEACTGEPELRAEVEALLRAEARAGAFLERPAPEDLQLVGPTETAAAGRPGERIGPYRILHELGRGGMGAVYLAERTDGGFEQHVAIKLVKRGMDSEAIVRRFLSERQILARLSHPHIARLLDGGTTDDGRPYFAVEHVVGVPLTTYCQARQVALEARLALFAQVAEAVEYAHAQGVIHRDLKPSNILVTADGQVKLLDFGIAKVLHAPAAGGVTLTELGLRVFTPEHGAPEQVRGEPASAATDVYALGTVLYELLTGQRAHRLMSRTPREVERVVCEQDPIVPSQAVADTTLARRLRGDLDAITLKALRKEPSRRYASVAGLLDDLRRRARGLPVDARRGSITYRARKLVRRHRLRAAFALLFVALAAAVWGMWARARAAAAEAARVREIEAYALSLLDGAGPAGSAVAGGSDEDRARLMAIIGGRRIVFQSDRGGRGFDLYALEGDSAILLVRDAGRAAWSPDGTRLAFERTGDLFTVAADGSDLRPLTSGPAWDTDPAWSPDGKRIAFASSRVTNDFDIIVVNADGTGAITLVQHPGVDGEPTWSPDGRHLAFNSTRDGNLDIYVMKADGTDVRNLSHHPLADLEPVWSPDGQRIAFVSTRDGNYDVWVMNADGSDPVNLTRHPAADGQPAWSPDGRLIVFSSDRRRQYDVYVMRVDGTMLGNLTHSAGDDAWPVWR